MFCNMCVKIKRLNSVKCLCVSILTETHPQSEEWVHEKVLNSHSHIKYIHVHIYPMRPKLCAMHYC